MSRDAYFRYLEDTASAVSPFIANLFAKYQKEPGGLYDPLMHLAGTRFFRPLQKPGVFRLVFELCGGEEWQRYIPVAAAFEVLNISSYQANASFDKKLGTLTVDEKDAQYICSMISRELSSETIECCQHLSHAQKSRIKRSLSKINQHIYLAQYLDLFVLKTSDINRYSDNESLFLKDYFLRCRHGSGVFNAEVVRCAAELAGCSEEMVQNIAAYGELFGTALHLVNDLGDYAPYIEGQPSPRLYQDRYSDFKNGRLTLVLYHLMSLASPETQKNARQLLNGRMDPECDFRALSQLVYTGGSYHYAKAHAKRLYRQAHSLVVPYSKSELYPLLMQSLSVLRNNKYTAAFNFAFRK